MSIIKTKGEYEFRLANGHLAGKIIYDSLWRCWRFVGDCRLDFDYIKELYKFMRKLR